MAKPAERLICWRASSHSNLQPRVRVTSFSTSSANLDQVTRIELTIPMGALFVSTISFFMLTLSQAFTGTPVASNILMRRLHLNNTKVNMSNYSAPTWIFFLKLKTRRCRRDRI
jgi:hypothetical protein